MLFEAMEQMASTITTASARVKVARRPLFGPTRVSVLRRANRQCISGTDEPMRQEEELVEAVVQSGMVREGQILEAALSAPTVFSSHSRSGDIVPKPATVATFKVVRIQRFNKPR
jgi:hypothetical protein